MSLTSPGTFTFSTSSLQPPATAKEGSGFHKLPSPRSRYNRLSASTEQPASSGSPLGLKTSRRVPEEDKLLKAASSRELDDQFQKSVLDGVKPGSENVKASEVRELAKHETDHAIKSNLMAELLKRLALANQRHKSPPSSPSHKSAAGSANISQLI